MRPDSAQRLQDGLARLGQGADPEQMRLWIDFLDLLYRWNRVHSLTAVADEGLAVERHLIDALQVWSSLQQALRTRQSDQPAQILDVGSGTGVPGIPLAIALPETRWTLVERVARKAAFLRQAVARLGLAGRVEVQQADVRDLTHPVGYEIILSRAFAALPRFVEWTQHLAHDQTRWAYLAGRLERIPGLEQEYQRVLQAPVELPGLRDGLRRRVVQALALGPQNDRHLVWVSTLREREAH